MQLGLRQFLFIIVLLAMPVANYYVVFQPRNAQIAAARAEIQRKQDKLAALERATRNSEDLGAEIEKLTSTIQRIEERLPAEHEVEVILQQVWELATRHELTPRSIRTDKPHATAQYTEQPIKLVIIGDFDGFYGFLLDLAKMKRITRMPRMKLVKTEREEGQMQANLLLSIFYEARAPKGDGAGAGAGS